MASEIHDTLAQAFTGNLPPARSCQTPVHQEPQTVQQILEHLTQLAETGTYRSRRSVWSLYPPAVEYADLAQLLYESVEQMTRNTSISVEVNVQGTPRCLPPFIGLNLLRVGQEALTNAHQTRPGKHISIELSYEPVRVFLTIRDDGRGFTPPPPLRHLNGGFGLVGMYERCDRIGAQLSLSSQPRARHANSGRSTAWLEK
jgi:signal transduction histidine kinase